MATSICWNLLFAFSCIALSVTCRAQDTPTWELHVGYQFAGYQSEQLRSLVNSLTATIGSPSANVSAYVNTNGWDSSGQENLNDWFGGIFDVSGGYGRKRVYFNQSNGLRIPVDFRVSTYTFGEGPQFTFRKGARVQPFARVIFAGTYSYASHNAFTMNPLVSGAAIPKYASDLAFAAIGGGGMDYRLSHHSYLRVGGDYIHTSFAGGAQNNFRVTAGIDFRIFTN
jgi:hypothetical protein